jgi:hypothetical protein
MMKVQGIVSKDEIGTIFSDVATCNADNVSGMMLRPVNEFHATSEFSTIAIPASTYIPEWPAGTRSHASTSSKLSDWERHDPSPLPL